MKLLCILISFALLNVMVAVLDEYKRQVIITNKFIELARDRMPEIIRDIIVNGNYTIEKISLMVAVPESEDIHGHLNISYQVLMRGEIRANTGLRLPEINEGYYENVTLQDLGRARRIMITEAIINLIRDVLRMENNPSLRYNSNIHVTGRRNICHLLGLFRSVKHPSSHVVTATILRYDTCTLCTNTGAEIRYRYIHGKIWEINVNDFLIQPLSDQLQ